MAELVTCAHCGVRVVPTASGECPSCRQTLAVAPVDSQANPFSESPNAYASPPPLPGAAHAPDMFGPGIALFVVSMVSTFSFAFNVMYWSNGGYLDLHDPDHQRSISLLFTTSVTLLISSLTALAGAVAMVSGKARWLQWIGAVISVIPGFSSCYVLGIPFGIWAIMRLRKMPPETRRMPPGN